jgi:hypothetical protein
MASRSSTAAERPVIAAPYIDISIPLAIQSTNGRVTVERLYQPSFWALEDNENIAEQEHTGPFAATYPIVPISDTDGGSVAAIAFLSRRLKAATRGIVIRCSTSTGTVDVGKPPSEMTLTASDSLLLLPQRDLHLQSRHEEYVYGSAGDAPSRLLSDVWHLRGFNAAWQAAPKHKEATGSLAAGPSSIGLSAPLRPVTADTAPVDSGPFITLGAEGFTLVWRPGIFPAVGNLVESAFSSWAAATQALPAAPVDGNTNAPPGPPPATQAVSSFVGGYAVLRASVMAGPPTTQGSAAAAGVCGARQMVWHDPGCHCSK